MKLFKLSVFLIALMISSISCSQFIGDSASLEVEEIASELFTNYPKEGIITEVISSQPQLESEWKDINRGIEPMPEVPMINFDTRTVVLVMLNSKPSGAYAFHQFDIEKDADITVVNFAEKHPGDNCITTSVITRPYKLVSIPTTNKSIQFNQMETQISNCGE